VFPVLARPIAAVLALMTFVALFWPLIVWLRRLRFRAAPA
jgi:hypothetical protein